MLDETLEKIADEAYVDELQKLAGSISHVGRGSIMKKKDQIVAALGKAINVVNKRLTQAASTTKRGAGAGAEFVKKHKAPFIAGGGGLAAGIGAEEAYRRNQ